MNTAEQKIEQLKLHINSGETQQALGIIVSKVIAQDFGFNSTSDDEAEAIFAKKVSYLVLSEQKSTNELMDAALTRFVETKKGDHGHWVHSLSGLMSRVYHRNLGNWVKRLNEIAFTGAIETGNSSCCDRLVEDFLGSAPWNAVPADYGITEESLQWVPSIADYLRESMGRSLEFVRKFPFDTEEKCPRKPFYRHDKSA